MDRRDFLNAGVAAVVGTAAIGSGMSLAGTPRSKGTGERRDAIATVTESARSIPIVYDVDVVVVGGSSGAVSAAIAASEAGAKVFLIAPRPYLGDDLCETRRLWLEKGEVPASPLARRLFAADAGKSEPKASPPDDAGFARLVRPMHVKYTLDQAMIQAKAEFLFSCFPSDLLRGADGNPCGIVMANRSGRQAVLAKVIIDATPRAVVARMAGAECSTYSAGEQVFQRVVIGGALKNGTGFTGRKLGLAFPVGRKASEKEAELIEYTLRLPMPDASFASFAAADQLSRDLLWQPEMLEIADSLFQVPPDSIRGVKSMAGDWEGAAAADLDCFRPAGLSRLYVLGGCVDMARESAAKLLRPLALIDAGARVGQAAAAEAKATPSGKDPRVADPIGAARARDEIAGEVKESLVGIRPTQRGLPAVSSPKRQLPVLGEYDVVVIGGGTGGAAAGIGAARGGAKTLVVEYLNGLGGVGTQGRIAKYWFGYRGGFTAEVDAGAKGLRAANSVLGKTEWWRQANRQENAEIWFGAMGCGAFTENGVVKGVVVATPFGRGVVLGKTVIDSTGNADVAAAAGAPCDYTDGSDVAVQGAGLPPLELGDHYTNTDWTFADDTDVVDFWQHYVAGRSKFRDAYDLGQLMDTRERRRIVGDVVISPMDIVLGRFWPDTINRAESNFDTHGFTVHPMFFAMPPGHERLGAWVPLRALLPRGLDGILVTGLGVSAHRDAMPVIRMQADVQNQGYACGKAASMAAKANTAIRGVDIQSLQQHLQQIGVLKDKSLLKKAATEEDRSPISKEKIEAAVADLLKPDTRAERQSLGLVKNREALAIVFSQPAKAMPLLWQALLKATGAEKVAYALVLGLMGDTRAADALVEHIRSAPAFDKGWNFTGMGQFGRSVSELDACIIALGRTGDPRTIDVVLEKVRLLEAGREFSHHRACAMALETQADPRAAAPLAQLLQMPEMSGHAVTTIEAALNTFQGAGTKDTKDRNESLRELILARALYRCGDKDRLGRGILEQYAQDLRGHYARHARAVLDERRER